MAGEDEPGGDAPVHLLQMVLEEGVLLCADVKVVFSAHHNKVDLSIVKPEPARDGRSGCWDTYGGLMSVGYVWGTHECGVRVGGS